MTPEEEKIIDEIQKIREDNNKLWINILRFAMRAVPSRTKAAVSLITKNDKKISELFKRLSRG